ncbi:MAG: aldehyde ferredoxin oxidoreductase C-terminal domain-containing protein [Syntrophorhabdales bacterium]|jgi:aldehyde:ferredoxin oxidoreductase
MKRLLRIDMGTRHYTVEDIAGPYKNLGGRGLSSTIIHNEVPPMADPLGPENKLIFAAGILAGSKVPNSGRLSVGAKSPLTNGIKEANAGGTASQKLARLGYQAVIVEGCAAEPCTVKIDKGGVTFSPAAGLKRLGNYEVVDRLKRNNTAIICIGPAGELKLRAAAVAVTSWDFHIRVAGRGGLGAVMGSKNLKAVVIDDTDCGGQNEQDDRTMRAAVKELSKHISSNPVSQAFRQMGTPFLVMLTNTIGCLPTRNYSVGQFGGAEKISGEHMHAQMKKRPNSQSVHRCMNGCVISCSNVYTDKNGEVIVSGLEYETLGLVGANCMIDDLDAVARINRACNDVGVDTMDVGAAIAVSMEAGLLPWGDGAKALSLIEEIAKGTENGVMIGNGCRAAGEKLGVKRIPHVKGQSLAAYDPRVLKGTGVTYATSTMGADHTCGNALGGPSMPEYNPSAPDGQGPLSQFLQTFFAAIDTLGLCLMASVPLVESPEMLGRLVTCVSSLTGEALPEDYLIRLGTAVLKTERLFNEAAGLGKKDDRLPQFFLEEPLPPSGTVFDVPEGEIDGVYEAIKGGV